MEGSRYGQSMHSIGLLPEEEAHEGVLRPRVRTDVLKPRAVHFEVSQCLERCQKSQKAHLWIITQSHSPGHDEPASASVRCDSTRPLAANAALHRSTDCSHVLRLHSIH